MGIWIRSQNKQVLTYSNDIWIADKHIYANPISETLLGEYVANPEAMQVLDMVQEHLSGRISFTGPTMGWGGNEHGCYVFQMPPAGDIKQCPNGCGEMKIAGGHINTIEGDTYFSVFITYCPECKYIHETDADL